jgi:hypothetical protein
MIIRCSPSNSEFFKTGYAAQHHWDCDAQCGGNAKFTFFFEAFPEQGMIRSDSKLSMQDAEQKAWNKYQKLKNCILDHKDHNNLDRKDYNNGGSFCKGCNQFICPSYSKMKPNIFCIKCNCPTYYSSIKSGYCCEKCFPTIPDNELNEWQLDHKYKRGVWGNDET